MYPVTQKDHSRTNREREKEYENQHLAHIHIQALFCCARTSALNFPSRNHSRPLSRFPTRFPNAFPTEEKVKIVALVLCQSVNQFRFIRNKINIHVNRFAFDFIDCEVIYFEVYSMFKLWQWLTWFVFEVNYFWCKFLKNFS